MVSKKETDSWTLIKNVTILISAFLILLVFLLVYTSLFSVFGGSSEAKGESINLSAVNTGEALDFNNLASLSAKYESNGNAGTIANNAGDPGGASYGAFQFASNTGSLNSFLVWLNSVDVNLCTRLLQARNSDGGYRNNFNYTWQQIAQENQNYFYMLQYNYIKQAYFDVVINYFKNRNIDFTKRTKTLQDVIWSIAVQHGSGGAIYLIGKLDLNLCSDLADDTNLIRNIYAERRKVNIYFESCSISIKNAVYNRFINEEMDALAMLKKELG